MINGLINIYKPTGLTSNKVLGVLKHALRELNIKTKVGHMGTLDPLATGVLPVALGRATRLFDYSLDKIKIYEAEFIFGAESASLDTDTEVFYNNIPELNVGNLYEVIKSHIGEIEQMPPIYSAKSVNGVRAYKLARNGVIPELKPKKINVYNIYDVIKTDTNKFKMKIECSSGTYIRSIGRDIAVSLGTTAVMCSLVRLKSGMFDINNSCTLEEISTNPQVLFSKIISLKDFLKELPTVFVEDIEFKKLINGVKFKKSNIISNELYTVYNNENLIGIGTTDSANLFYIKTWLL